MSAADGFIGNNVLGAKLASLAIRDLLAAKQGREMVVLDVDMSVSVALQALVNEDLLSAPVIDSATGTYRGWLEMLDIINLALGTCVEGRDAALPLQRQDAVRISNLSHRFGETKIGTLMTPRKLEEWCPVSQNGTVTQLADAMFARGVHRAPVVNDRGTVIDVVTQSDVLKCVLDHLGDAGEALEQTVQSLHLAHPAVISMSADALTIHAFFLMYYKRVSAVAIVDSKGVLIGNLSASDIRGLPQASFSSLFSSTAEYVAHNRIKLQPPVTVTQRTTLEAVLMQLGLHRVHRVWVVDEHQKPVGVCSLTDVMRYVLKISPST